MSKDTNGINPNAYASNLHAALTRKGVCVKLATVMEAVAQATGTTDWNTVAALTKTGRLAAHTAEPTKLRAPCPDSGNDAWLHAKRLAIEAAGYTVVRAGESSWYALLPGYTEFFDNADEADEGGVAHVQNYRGFFSSERDLIEDVFEETLVDGGYAADLRHKDETSPLQAASAPGARSQVPWTLDASSILKRVREVITSSAVASSDTIVYEDGVPGYETDIVVKLRVADDHFTFMYQASEPMYLSAEWLARQRDGLSTGPFEMYWAGSNLDELSEHVTSVLGIAQDTLDAAGVDDDDLQHCVAEAVDALAKPDVSRLAKQAIQTSLELRQGVASDFAEALWTALCKEKAQDEAEETGVSVTELLLAGVHPDKYDDIDDMLRAVDRVDSLQDVEGYDLLGADDFAEMVYKAYLKA